MMFRVETTPLFLPHQADQYVSFFLSSDRRFICCLSLTGSQAHELGPQLVAKCHAYTIETALLFHQFLSSLLEEATAAQQELSFAVIGQEGESCFLAAKAGQVYLDRDQKRRCIVSADDELLFVEGKIKVGDRFSLSVSPVPATRSLIQDMALAQPLVEWSQVVALFSAQVESLALAPPPAIGSVLFEKQDQSKQTEEKAGSGVSLGKGVGSAVGKSAGAFGSVIQSGVQFVRQTVGQVFSRDVYVRRQKRRQLLRVVLPLTIILLSAAGVVVFERARQTQQRAAATAIIEPVETQLTQIRAAAESDPVAARQQTEALIIQLEEQVQKVSGQSTTTQLLKAELAKLRSFYDSISGQAEFPVLPTFFDLQRVQTDWLASRIAVHQDSLLLLDTGKNRVAALDIDKKTTNTLPVGDLSRTIDLAFNDKEAVILGNGIFKFALGSDQPATSIRASEDENVDAQFVRLFSPNVYVLNKVKRSIYRYVPDDSGKLDKPTSWLKSGESLDFDAVQSMALDGEIWLGMRNGEIVRLSAGRREAFTPNGLKDPFSSPIQVFTDEESTNLYVLEPQKERVVIMDKKGDVLREVKSSSLSTATNIVASEKFKKVFILSGSLIFEIAL